MDILGKNLLILASAGSGKTYQLGNRVIGLVARGVAPERIVALTFTRKAAGEFADAVLTKLAAAAADQASAARLRDETGVADADFAEALERVVKSLPRLTLGTMDSFFARVVRGFQYELGLSGGKFDLLEGPRAAAMQDELLNAVLGGDALGAADGERFFHAFRRATIGRENRGVMHALREYVRLWQDRHRADPKLEWGPPRMAEAAPQEWEKRKSALAATVLDQIDKIVFTDKRQRAALEKAVLTLEQHRIGSGSLAKAGKLLDGILAHAGGPAFLTLSHYKEFTIHGPAADALSEMAWLVSRCEFAAALERTRALREVVALFDDLCEKRLRRNGMLQFNDVKLLMGEWERDERSRLRREAVDFRLDARHDHWLLDEFQDTSRADWTGLLPLINEAATGEEGTMFIVGDRKQAIYGWRGGDVRLFDEVIDCYRGDLKIEPMEVSWRSCPEVLELVNRVCGDVAAMSALFGPAARRWTDDWREHVSAKPLTAESKRGEARVEVVGDWDARLDRMAEILAEIGVGNRRMTCGVLLRDNDSVKEVADFLRTRHFDVIEEGRRLPAKDNPLGVVVHQLLKWLADPGDPFAREVIEMSPMAAVLRETCGESWPAMWESLTRRISSDGHAAAIGALIDPLWSSWSDFGRRRAGDLMGALVDLDARGVVSPAEAADWIARLEIAQSPGEAAVQVMTIHKSKGLGFDVVLLPEIPDTPLPQTQRFEIAEGPDWIAETPPKWARDAIPALSEAEERWAADQRHEGFCMLYVALTRAKRGLYALLDTPAATADPLKASLANWLACAVQARAEPGVVFQAGSADWPASIPGIEAATPPAKNATLGKPVPKRRRATPSGAKSKDRKIPRSASGMRFGSALHALMEQVGWIDESPPTLPSDDAGRAVARLLANPSLAEIFHRHGRAITLRREQPIDCVMDGELLSGIIDRLHLHHDPAGNVALVEIIDFKTDAVDAPEELTERYSGQMEAYRSAMGKIHPGARIECLLLSVRLGALVTVQARS
ncbi:MAG: UvrD-helicase domain-containing protein [Luteolibacter sp.]